MQSLFSTHSNSKLTSQSNEDQFYDENTYFEFSETSEISSPTTPSTLSFPYFHIPISELQLPSLLPDFDFSRDLIVPLKSINMENLDLPSPINTPMIPTIQKTEAKGKNDLDDTENWGEERKKRLLSLAFIHGNDWKKIASIMQESMKNWTQPSQIQKNLSKAKPSLKKKNQNFTVEEDCKLKDLVKVFGLNWQKISQYFNGRKPQNLKNRYYYFLKRKDVAGSLSLSMEDRP